METPLILASGSPRRQEILNWMSFSFKVFVPQLNETLQPNEAPKPFAKRMAKAKAQEALAIYPEGLILAADTVVVIGQTILGKPKNNYEAAKMLRLLSGRTHYVITAFNAIKKYRGLSISEEITTKVRFRVLEEEEIMNYVKSGDPLDKAGAYGIQGQGGVMVADLQGSHTNVIGLPAAQVYAALKSLGLDPDKLS